MAAMPTSHTTAAMWPRLCPVRAAVSAAAAPAGLPTTGSPPDTAVPAAVSTSPEIGSVVGTRLTPARGSRSPGHSSRTATMAHRP